MIRFDSSDNLKKRPEIQMTSMIDIMFINLLFFMALFVYFHFESELKVAVPKAKASTELNRPPGDIIINVLKDGSVYVNQKKRTLSELDELLKETSEIYAGQEVVIRADEKAYHEDVVRVLDVCADAKIWNISFATIKEK